jgi:hypothetical protein
MNGVGLKQITQNYSVRDTSRAARRSGRCLAADSLTTSTRTSDYQLHEHQLAVLYYGLDDCRVQEYEVERVHETPCASCFAQY